MKRFFFYRYGSEEVKPTDLLMSNTSVSGDYSKQNSLRIITGRGMTLNRECIHGRCQIVLRANINRVFFYEIQAEQADTSGRGRTVRVTHWSVEYLPCSEEHSPKQYRRKRVKKGCRVRQRTVVATMKQIRDDISTSREQPGTAR
jgi:hypothetical protein